MKIVKLSLHVLNPLTSIKKFILISLFELKTITVNVITFLKYFNKRKIANMGRAEFTFSFCFQQKEYLIKPRKGRGGNIRKL